MGSAPTGRTTANTPRAAFEVKTEETRTGSRSTSETSLITTSGTAPTSTMSAAAVEVGSPVPLERNSRVEEIEEKEVEEITETAPADPEKVMKHPLQNAWTLWFFKNDKTRTWEENQRPITTVTTVEDFWSLYNHIEVASRLPPG